ncbi:mechanosensitive ion channel family protein [Algisphaera agarilytica]|uniref:Small-conductance mechanosensitive channel n=1 Tax=Algisphaera agarilytica TaxID=1385975 RepID=A0A7X0H5L4_9BACT|nr:mechanosensitive ion channel family protein [Algisphaera agarilytica]MBB6429664.1 small-conductance mechanosensitive channel [Algisphaera agarilytica]
MLDQLLQLIPKALPFTAVLLAMALTVTFAHWALLRRDPLLGYEARRSRQLVLLAVVAVCVVLTIIALPLPVSTREQLLSLVGLVTTAVIGLSSTTFVAHAMAGFMLRSTKSFHVGDFLKIGDHFGRVTERGLMHTEIQTEDRDLTTLPNLHLITHPYTVVRASGTIVSAEVGLGYGVHHAVVEPLLLSAARQIGLGEPFVRVMALNDFSVTYRVSGLLKDPQQMLTTRSRLHNAVLDTLHGNEIEIMSPTFMVQRPQPNHSSEIPESVRKKDRVTPKATAEDVAFDKAEAASEKEKEVLTLAEKIKRLEGELREADSDQKPQISEKIEQLKERAEQVERERNGDEGDAK